MRVKLAPALALGSGVYLLLAALHLALEFVHFVQHRTSW
jgi:hypothetical protein